jgi:uncharacterized MAPEG superfamily protein
MSFELAMLAASCVLCLVQIVISSHAASLQRGYRWTASSRDTEVPPLTGVAGRFDRALRNFLETFTVFVAAVFLVHVLGRESALSEWGAGLYFRPGWFTFYSTQPAFPCSARSSGSRVRWNCPSFARVGLALVVLAFQPPLSASGRTIDAVPSVRF